MGFYLTSAKLEGIARGVRAAIVVPLLFAPALLVIRQPEMAGVAVFGTFAHLVMVDYNADAGARSAQAATLTVLGAILIGLGTLCSSSLWLAAGGATAAGLLAKYPEPGSARNRLADHLAALRPALLGVHAGSRRCRATGLVVSSAVRVADRRPGGARPIAVALDSNSSGRIAGTAGCRLIFAEGRNFCRSSDGGCRVDGTPDEP
jgi:hypothetical protein